MEPEYWRRERPTTLADAQEGLRNYLNYFNTERPHEGRKYHAPADDQPWFRPLPERYWEAVAVPERLGPQEGIVEANRLVGNDGTVETWGQTLRVSPLLGGPPTRGARPFRVRFEVTGRVGAGSAHYEQRKGQDIVVATFEHSLDAAGEGGPAWQLYPPTREARPFRLVDFDAELPQNEVLDEGHGRPTGVGAAQQSRVHKRRSLLERRR